MPNPRLTERFGDGAGLEEAIVPQPLATVPGVGVGEGEMREGVVFRDIAGDMPWRRSASLPKGALITADRRG